VKEFPGIKLNPNFGSPLETNSYKGGKKPEENPRDKMDDMNNLCYCNFVPNSTDFEIELRFFHKFEFKEPRHFGTMLHQCTNLDMECPKRIYNQCSSSWMASIDQLLR
jgi:hypothetical protein